MEKIITDWAGNKINKGDKIKIIQFKKLKEGVEFKKCEYKDGEIRFINPEFIKKFEIKEGLEPSKTSIVPKEEKIEFIFREIKSFPIVEFCETEWVFITPITGMNLDGFYDWIQTMMQDCIIAIEGKSDNEIEFFTKYFEA